MPSFAGEFTVPGATQEVYELLMDPHRLAKCLPDLKRYEVQDQNHFTVTLRVGLGRVRGPMTMKLEIVEKRENSYARMTGKGTVLNSKVNIDGNFTLSAEASGATLVKWTGNAKLGAHLTHVAGGLVDRLVPSYIEQFVRAVEAEAIRGAAPPERNVSMSLRHLWRDIVNSERFRKIVDATSAALGAVGVVCVKLCKKVLG